MWPPENKIIYESAIVTFWFDDDGILNAVSKDTPRTIDGTKQYIQEVRSLLGGQKVCAILDVSNASQLKKDEREYIKHEIETIYKAVAIITHSQFSKIVGALLLFLIPTSIPAKAFTNEQEAREWIKQYL